MSRDYANRKPTKRTPRSKKKQAPSSRLPIIPLLIATIGIGGFGYFLWNIKDSAETTQPVSKPVKTKPKPKNELPPKPQDKWSYQDILENKEVQVDVPKKEPQPNRSYQMQCGSFRSEAQAESMRAKIAFQGLSSNVRRTEGKNGVWYRVYLGPYDRKRAAERERHKLQAISINTCIILLKKDN
ncbi:sporulation protein [Parashewanella curva]|uniref:Sporulation protein n=1 Tax=Parashewanella curva TaxID=2338552 RepID=A0A3L8PXH8_9GAMM|nr:SPOR domain-containing protein [Parashewanella curva]RLV60004.1 sporulation protein [Parashewanella curva]